ncbi:DNA-binding NtrC family response regulator [Geothermobacter ehrlichii]|uniref:DNA-binding NtrC family response regulator n=1 Tax=Geothermobacter ehrlichii TaxID=213224 RepID=A0A5D3WIX9_9BACT|nr:sigma 54-interacting transcriptional regulator [Geothermobacter ehrlichii]TYO98225.1 DNA-binding NtrC family response regulator [Geothermobacter ehrlichii]
MGPITTDRDLCRKCYACVRNCPVKAIKVKEDCTEVIHERCIGCGKCLRSCSQNAKQIADCIDETRRLLAGGSDVVAVLGCSFPAFFNDIRPGQLVTALKKLGFVEVHEGTSGVELIRDDYRRLIERPPQTPLISSHCPTVVDLIERHYPQLLKNLLPVVSPMVAIGRFIKQQRGSDTRVIYISSCIAGKFEIAGEPVAGAIDTVLTYRELNIMLDEHGYRLREMPETPFDGIEPHQGRIFPIAGGPFRAFGIPHDSHNPDYIATEGEENALEIIRDLAAGRIRPRVVDIRFCNGGCIGGPGKNNRLTTFTKRHLIYGYHQSTDIPYRTAGHYLDVDASPDLGRTFTNKHRRLTLPSAESIRQILRATNKHSEKDELNCGACGYHTCREHAVAVYQGLAEGGMCLPYSLQVLEEDRFNLAQKYELARRALDQEFGDLEIIAEDGKTREVLDLIRQVGPTPTTVLIRGESGTGKELTARAIHRQSLRADRPLVTVNCTTLPDSLLESELFGHVKGAFTGAHADKKGLFETASGGTIFLDEIGDITPKLQAELLRVLDNGEIKPVGSNRSIKVDIRLITATNKNLEQGVREGWFREDLFYRLNVFTINLPPLRNRRESLPALAHHFVERASKRLNKPLLGIEDRAVEAMLNYHWPGNIRELQNIIERAAVLTQDNVIHLDNLPVVFAELYQKLQLPADRPTTFNELRSAQVGRIEANLLKRYLQETGGNVSAAARKAQLPRRTFYRLLERHGIDSKAFRRRPT